MEIKLCHPRKQALGTGFCKQPPQELSEWGSTPKPLKDSGFWPRTPYLVHIPILGEVEGVCSGRRCDFPDSCPLPCQDAIPQHKGVDETTGPGGAKDGQEEGSRAAGRRVTCRGLSSLPTYHLPSRLGPCCPQHTRRPRRKPRDQTPRGARGPAG